MSDANDIIFASYQLDIEAIIRSIYTFFVGPDGDFETFFAVAAWWWNVYIILASVLSILLLVGFIYAKIRYNEMLAIEQDGLREAEAKYVQMYGGIVKNSRWQDVLSHIDSENPNDWRLAIIEADILLENLLDTLGYSGTTIGDRLKQASVNTFQSLNDAWEAHKVRNQIAHAGSDFVLTRKVARDTIGRYRRVFGEFDFV